jgi:hypothetical protein
MRLHVRRRRLLATLLVATLPAAPSALAEEPAAASAEGDRAGEGGAAVAASRDEPADAAASVARAGAGAEDMTARRSQLVRWVIAAARETIERKLFPYSRVDPELLVPHYVAEYTRQFRPLLTTELQFIVKTCGLSPAERETIASAGEASLDLLVQDYADLLVRRQREGYRSEEPDWPDPREVIMEALRGAVGKTVAADRAKLYEEEIEKRSAARKRVTRDYIVASLDRELLLTAAQRDQLAAVVSASWQDRWERSLEVLHHGDYYFPPLPGEEVLAILTEAQRAIWSGRDRNRRLPRGWTGFGFFQPAPDEAPPQAEAAAEAGEERPEAGDQAAAKPEEES